MPLSSSAIQSISQGGHHRTSTGLPSIPPEDTRSFTPTSKETALIINRYVQENLSDPCVMMTIVQQLADPERSVFPKGLGKLIVHEIIDTDPLYFPNLYNHEDSDGYVRAPASPVPTECLRPSNYDYTWCRVPYGPKWWDAQTVKKHVEKVVGGGFSFSLVAFMFFAPNRVKRSLRPYLSVKV